MSASRRSTRTAVVVWTAVAAMLVVVGLAGRWVLGLDDPEPTPAHLVEERRAVGIAVEDVRFVEPLSIETKGERCDLGGFPPDSYLCRYVGVATFPTTADVEALAAHLEQRGWTDNRQIQENDASVFAYHRLVDGTDVCASTHVYDGVLSVTTSSGSMCVDNRPSESRRWDGWTLLVPDVPPGGLEVRTRSLDIERDDDVVTLALRYRRSDPLGAPMVEVRERRLPEGVLAEDCYAAPDPARPSTPERPRCRPLLTTPSGRVVLVDRADTRPGGARLARRSWFVVIDRTVVEIERIDPAPTEPAATDAELAALIDSLRPATYDEIHDTYRHDDGIEPNDLRYDEPPACREGAVGGVVGGATISICDE